MAKGLSKEEFAKVWAQCDHNPKKVSEALNMPISSVYRRRQNLAKKDSLILKTIPGASKFANKYYKTGWQINEDPYKPRESVSVKNGCVVVFSDAHYWPGRVSTAHKAMLVLLKKLKPKIIIANGDLFDGSGVSRHDPLGWVRTPTVIQELDTVKIRLREIEQASPKSKYIMTVGNHDSRMDRRLATESPEFGGVEGFRLQDHIKNWSMSYSVMINEDLPNPVMVKHALKGGVHAVYNNTLHAGVSIVTGHLHAQLCRPFTDYRGTRYGVDAGFLADPKDPAFAYTMDNPLNWRSGFAVLTFDSQGNLFPPELCEVQIIGKKKRAIFRNEIVI